MGCTEAMKTTVPRDLRAQAKEIADRELLSEAAWLKRLVLREVRACHGANGDGDRTCSAGGVRNRRAARAGGCARAMLVRLGTEDKLLLDARAEARGLRPATYASVLLRSHLRKLTPLPKDELAALKRAVAELGAVGRNLSQIARAANQGGRVVGPGHDEFRAFLRICEALRDDTKDLIKANTADWASGRAEDAS